MQCCCIAHCIVPCIATIAYCIVPCIATIAHCIVLYIATIVSSEYYCVYLPSCLLSFLDKANVSGARGLNGSARLGAWGAPPNTVRSVGWLVGSRLVSSRLTARDGRGLTARGHNVMARELTPSYVSWAHSSSICGALLSLRVSVRNETVIVRGPIATQ